MSEEFTVPEEEAPLDDQEAGAPTPYQIEYIEDRDPPAKDVIYEFPNEEVYCYPCERNSYFFVKRLEPKGFRQFHIDKHGNRIYKLPNMRKRPIFGDPNEIINHDQILVVSGERTCIAARNRSFGRPWYVVTWSGGDGAVGLSDWNGMAGKRVVIWPDNDLTGKRAGQHLAGLLGAMNVRSQVIDMDSRFREKWDLADENPDGIDNGMIVNMIVDAFRHTGIDAIPYEAAQTIIKEMRASQEMTEAYSPAAQGSRGTMIDKRARFQHLGYDKEVKKFYFFSKQFGQVVPLSARDLSQESAYMQLDPNRGFWEDMWNDFCENSSAKGKFNWADLGWKIVSEFAKAKVIYDPNNVRGRGAWMDGGKFVFHIGDRLIVDGQEIQHGELSSKYIYTLSAKFLEGFDNRARELSDNEGMTLIDACEAASFDNIIYSHLYAGWLVNSLVCGALSWRPHIWLTGNAESGKTEIQKQITSFVVNDFGIYPKGESTEAGIRINLSGDARPVIYDESEAETREGIARIQNILSTMRVSSKESKGSVMKGTQNHGSVSFDVRSMYCLSSIGVALKQQADLSRVTVLGVSLPPKDTEKSRKQRADMEEAFVQRVRELHAIPNITCRLFLRIARNIQTHLDNIVVMSNAIAKVSGSRRSGDQLGTLLAGFYLLQTTRPLDMVTAESIAAAHSLAQINQNEIVTTSEDEEIINTIMGKTVAVEQKYGRVHKKVGYLMRLASGREMYGGEGSLTPEQVNEALGQVGLRYYQNDEREGFLLASTREDYVNDLMKESRYAASWQKIMSRSHALIPLDKNVKRIGGVNLRCIWVDAKAFLRGEEKVQQSYSFYDAPQPEF